MASTTGNLTLSTKDVMQGMSLSIRIPRSFTLRTRIACWLIGLAGRVIDVPCEIEMRSDDEIKVGDTVRLKSGGPEMTVIVEQRRLVAEWPGDDGWMQRHGFVAESLIKLPSKSSPGDLPMTEPGVPPMLDPSGLGSVPPKK